MNSFPKSYYNLILMKTPTKIYLLLTFLFIGNCAFAQNAKIADSPSGTVISNAGGADIPHSSSILDVRSTSKGILLPRMSTANRDAIGSPHPGLLVYNTSTNQFNYYGGSSWQVASFGNQWGINGSILYHSGKVGIGTSTMTNANTFLTVNGNATISGTLTVNNGKGILYNSSGDTQLKYYTLQFTQLMGISPGIISGEISIPFSESFTNPPKVYVGDMVSFSCDVGQPYYLQLVIYGCTTTGCKARIINTGTADLACNITWNIICIGN